MVDIIGIIMVLEFPMTILGSWLLFKKITKNKEVQEWIAILREAKDAVKELLEEYKKNGPEH